MKSTSETNVDLDGTILPPFLSQLAFYVLCAASLIHFLILTPYTHNLDDIKYVTMAVGGAVCLLLYAMLWGTGCVRMPFRFVAIPYVLYIVSLVISTLLTNDYAKWIGWQLVAMHISFAGFFFLASATLSTTRMIRLSVRFWIITALITCIFGLIHFTGGMEGIAENMERSFQRNARSGENRSAIHMLFTTFAGQRQMLSTILNSQFFGGFLSFILPLCLAGAIVNYQEGHEKVSTGKSSSESFVWAGIAGIAALLCAICMFLTFSKTSWLTLLTGVSLFSVGLYLFTPYRIFKLPGWPVALLLFSVIVITVVNFSWADLKAQLSDLDNSLSSRGMIWAGAWEMFKDNPIWGAGPGSFRIDFPQYRSPDYHLSAISNVTLYAHNRFLDLLAENGIVGFVLYLAFLLAIFFYGIRAIRSLKDPSHRVMMLAFLVGLFCLYLGSFSIPFVRWPIGGVVLHLALGMTFGAAQTFIRGNVDVSQKTNRPLIIKIAYAATGLCVIWLATSTWLSYRFFKGSIQNNEGRSATNIAQGYASSRGDTPEDAIRREQAQLRYFADAAKYYENALELNPTFITAYYHKGFSYNRLGTLIKQQAFRDLTAMRKDGIQPAERNALEQRFKESFEYQKKALASYDLMREYAPDYSEVHLNAAILSMTMASDLNEFMTYLAETEEEKEKVTEQVLGLYKYAVDSIDRARSVSNKISVHFLAGRIHFMYAQALPQGSEESKEEYLEAARAQEITRDLQISVFIQQEGQRERERNERREAARLVPQLYQKAEAWEEAARAHEYIMKKYPGLQNSPELAVANWIRAEKPEEAIRVVDEVLAENPLASDFLLLRAELMMRSEDNYPRDEVLRELAYIRKLENKIDGFLKDKGRVRLERLEKIANPEKSTEET